MTLDDLFPKGLLRPELLMGTVVGVTAQLARVNLSAAGLASGSHFEASRYGRGEVGEFVLIEGQVEIVLGRLSEVRVPDSARADIRSQGVSDDLDAVGFVQLLGCLRPDTLELNAGIACYPRLGDRAYAAPHRFVGRIPQLLGRAGAASATNGIHLGGLAGRRDADVHVAPEKLFGRHTAILGATGGGKSWTVAHLIDECVRIGAKCMLLDATGEYHSLAQSAVRHVHLGEPGTKAPGSTAIGVPATDFIESDFVALFEPSGKLQAPKLREAIATLRLLQCVPQLGHDGCFVKSRAQQAPFVKALAEHARTVEDASSPFDVLKLARQVLLECVYPDDRDNPGCWGTRAESEYALCTTLAARIRAIVTSHSFRPVFEAPSDHFVPLSRQFLADDTQHVLRVCMGGVSYEYRAREFIANAIGRSLLKRARAREFAARPLIVFIDEAHNFLGKSIGPEDNSVRLDAFELIAREGRKYGLYLCLASQRPRDLSEGVLSQIGCMVVHRLTNERDRSAVETASGEIDHTSSAFLTGLQQGEAAVIGVDFPIPLTVRIPRPSFPPASDPPKFGRT